MNNDPKVPNDSIHTELQSEVASPKTAISRTTVAALLMAAALAALTVTSFIRTDQQAAANAASPIARAPAMASVPLDSGEVRSFRFGFLEFEDQSGGVPGFSALPSESRAQ